jgi:class 3 adenylate cyclase
MRGIKDFFKRPWTLRRRLAWSLTAVNLLGGIVFLALSYQAARHDTLDSIDTILCNAAEATHTIVPPIILNEAEATTRTQPAFDEQYRAAQALLERYFAETHLVYLYVIGVRPADGTAFEVISNLSPEQRARGMNPLKELLLKPYSPSDGMVAIARSGVRGIDVSIDEYGYFRSCYVPVTMPTGNVAIFGADMDVSDVDRKLYADLMTHGAITLIVLAVTLTVINVISRSVARDVGVAVAETEAVSRLDLKSGSARRRSAILEVDTLFQALFDMKNGLAAFSKFVPDAVIKRILSTGRAEIGGERRELSLLMTDVTGFTTISEQFDPERFMIVMSEYFDHVVKPILAQHGTLDKYVGDAVFSYWNAPLVQADHAALCCAAALESRIASNALVAAWEQQGLPPWRTRYGLHTGDVVFGNVGAPDRMDFTVIGSTVNIASRIEGLNKYYGTEILASERTRTLAQDQYVFRSVDQVLPKGAQFAFAIFELVGARKEVETDTATMAALTEWEAAYALFRARKWSEALAAFETYAALRPTDSLLVLYLTRCRAHIAAPPPATWDGVEHFDSK